MNIVVVAAVIEQNGRFLVTRRQPGVHLAGMWEFPGGKIDAGESRSAALEREIREELGAAVEIGDEIHETSHVYPERRVELHFYKCSLFGPPRPLLGQELRWVTRSELASLSFPPADAELIALLTASAAR
jgi:mutator protein MutT